MTERPENNDRREEQEPFVPASPVKRIMAWVGIVYMVGLVILNIYPFFNQGNYLTGIAPSLPAPALPASSPSPSIWPAIRTAPIPERCLWPFWRYSAP